MKHIQRNWGTLFVLLSSLLGLPGCNQLFDWGKKHLQQPEEQKRNCKQLIAQYVRHKKVYEQFTSLADFTALLLSDAVRLAYLDFYAYRNFKNAQEIQAARTRFLSENDYYISFYISAWQRPTEYISEYTLFTGERYILGDLLGSADAEWQLSMRIGGKEYEPESITAVQIPLEYKIFFAERLSQFKKTYLVRFAAKDANNNVLLDSKLHDVELIFRRLHQQITLSWLDTQYKLHE